METVFHIYSAMICLQIRLFNWPQSTKDISYIFIAIFYLVLKRLPSLEILEIAQLITNLDCLFSMIFCLWIFFPNKGFVRKIFSFFSFGNYFLKFSALFFSYDKFRCQLRKAISYHFFCICSTYSLLLGLLVVLLA